MSTLTVQDSKGKKVGEVKLSESLSKVKPKASVLHRVVVAEEANKRQGTHKTKTRSEARGGGRKPYRQKKTGRARQGTIRAPHYAHGGVAFGTSPRDYSKKINKKERRLAILSALTAKIDAGDVKVINEIKFEQPKTKQAVGFLKDVGAEGRVLVILEEYDENTLKSFRNIPRVEVRTAPAREDGDSQKTKTQSFSTRDLLVAKTVLVTQKALERIQEVWQ